MVKKILTISFTAFVALLIAATPAFASEGRNHYSQNKNNKFEIKYDVPDNGDNAHPSGKDRSVEHGHSFTQGKSKSDPDNNGKGPDRLNTGLDKPGKGGGVDKYDQDGNNGCGNDDDFEDDNEGWCGHKPKHEKPEKPKHDKPDHGDCKSDDRDDHSHPDEPEESEDPVTPEVVVTPVVTPTVLAVSELPQTGNDSANPYSFVYTAIALIGAGLTMELLAKKYEKSSSQA